MSRVNDKRAPCARCEDLLLLAMAKLCSEAYGLSSDLFDAKLSEDISIVPRSEHSKSTSCRLCFSLTHELAASSSILVYLRLQQRSIRENFGRCQISGCHELQALEMRVLQTDSKARRCGTVFHAGM